MRRTLLPAVSDTSMDTVSDRVNVTSTLEPGVMGFWPNAGRPRGEPPRGAMMPGGESGRLLYHRLAKSCAP
jgi:hypothetical protein